jgi:hypothetical protein
MTADDFFLLSIAVGGFLIFALVLWRVARIADRQEDVKRGPDNRTDTGSPSASNGHGRKQAARPGRTSDGLRRLIGWTAAATDRICPAIVPVTPMARVPRLSGSPRLGKRQDRKRGRSVARRGRGCS